MRLSPSLLLLLSAAGASLVHAFHPASDKRLLAELNSEHNVLQRRDAVAASKADSFYHPPAGYQHKAAGTVLRSRSIPFGDFNLTGTANSSSDSRALIKAAYQLLYRTYDSTNKKALTAVTTVLVPTHARSSFANATRNGTDIITYAVAYDSANPACGPSQLSVSMPTADFTAGTGGLVALSLQQGLVVNVPDYESSLAAFADGPLMGPVLLDSLRAVLGFEPAVPRADASKPGERARIVLEGYSGGAIVTGWAVQEMQPYAKELIPYVQGAAFGGVPSDPGGANLYQLDGSSGSGLVIESFASQANARPEVRAFFDKHLNSAGKEAFQLARTACLTDVLSKHPYTFFFDTFVNIPNGGGLFAPVVQRTTKSLRLAADASAPVPRVPIFIYSSEDDETVPHLQTTQYYSTICARTDPAPPSVHYLGLRGPTHAGAAGAIMPTRARRYLLDRLDGKAVQKGCSFEHLSIAELHAPDAKPASQTDL